MPGRCTKSVLREVYLPPGVTDSQYSATSSSVPPAASSSAANGGALRLCSLPVSEPAKYALHSP